MQNNSEYPKSNSHEANFPCISPVTILRSTSYRTVTWLPLGNSKNSLRHPPQVYRIVNFSTATWGKFCVPHIVSGWEWFPVFDWRGKPIFHKHLKRSLPSAIGMWEGLCVSCLKWNGPQAALPQKKAGFPCSSWNAGSSFISQDEGMSEYPVETL